MPVLAPTFARMLLSFTIFIGQPAIFPKGKGVFVSTSLPLQKSEMHLEDGAGDVPRAIFKVA